MLDYCLINNEAGVNVKDDDRNEIDSKFEKMEVYWPLPMLKNGIVLIDSPGLNDPYNHDSIVTEYVPKADAIIYLVNGSMPYTKDDKQMLTDINTYRFRSLIVVTTFFDIVRGSTFSQANLDEFVRVNNGHYAKHSELGTAAFHYVSSLDALKAKRSGDQALLEQSGYTRLESYLETYLVEHKATSQALMMTGSLMKLCEDMSKSAATQTATANLDNGELARRIKESQTQLENARLQAEIISKKFRTDLLDVLPDVKKAAHAFARDLAQSASLEDFTPELPEQTVFGKLNPFSQRKVSKQLAEDCMHYLKHQSEERIARWYEDTLKPLVNRRIQEHSEDLHGKIESFVMELSKLEDIIENGGAGNVKTAPGIGSYAVGILYGLVTQDWVTALVAPAYGARMFGRALLFQAGAGVALGVAACFVPITWPVIAIAAIGAGLAAIIGGGKSQVKAAKKAVLEKYKEGLATAEAVEETAANVEKNVRENLEKLADKMDEALKTDLETANTVIFEAIRQSERGVEENESRVALLKESGEKLQAMEDEYKQIADEYSLTKEGVA
jgi:hypothetical protein